MRIDSLTPGSFVTLRFNGATDHTEQATFVRVKGEKQDRRAVFYSVGRNGGYEWEAYRFNGGWAYGSSAERLSLVNVVAAA